MSEPNQSKKKRRRSEKEVVDTGPIDLRLAKKVQGEVSDIVAFNATALVEDLRGQQRDKQWAKMVGTVDLSQVAFDFFSGGHPLPEPEDFGESASDGEDMDITQDKIKATLKKEMLGPRGMGTTPKDGSTPEGIFAKGAYQQGAWKADGEEGVIEGPRNYTAEYDLMLANSVAQAFINNLKGRDIKVTEIQCMVLDDRVMVSANEQSAITGLVGRALDKIVDSPPTGIESWARQRQVDLKARRALLAGASDESSVTQMAAIVASANIYGEQATALVALASALKSSKQLVDAGSDPVRYVTSGGGANRVILVGSGRFCHAEQNLLVALVKSGYSGAVTVAGGKRPCAACRVAFALAQESVPQLRYVDNSGGAWFGSSRSSFSQLADALSVSMEHIQRVAARVLEREQYVTIFDTDAPESETVTDVRSRVMGKTVHTDSLPTERPVPTDLFSDYAEFVPSPTQVQREESEELSYQMGSQEEIPSSQEAEELERGATGPITLPPGFQPGQESDEENSQ